MPPPVRPVAPPQALRTNPDTFSTNAELAIQYQWDEFPDWIEAVAEYTEDQADAATAAALTGDAVPSPAQALNYLRLNAAGTGLEYRTPAQVLTDQGVTATGSALFAAADEAAGRAAIDAPAIPTASTGPGNFASINPASGAAAVLPSGGQWAYMIYRFSSGVVASSACGVAAGGTTIGGATGGQNWSGFAWRFE